MYQRTALGQQEINDRNLKIPSRTRTLLLLIESYDINQLDQKIANQTNFDTLLQLGLIIKKNAKNINIQQDQYQNNLQQEQQYIKNIVVSSSLNTPDISIQNKDMNLIQDQLINRCFKEQEMFRSNNLEQQDNLLSFQDLKSVMQNTLKQYCGLMSKNLVQAIAQTTTIKELRLHQKKWLTDLFETRISPQELATLKQHINVSTEHIEKHVQYLE